MAIVQQDPRLQQKEEEQVQTGAITGTQGAPMQELSPTAPQAPQQPSQGTQTQPSPQQAPQVTQRRSEAPRSGMATNVQHYIQTNQPQAQRMAQEVTKNVGRQAEDIRQSAQQSQARQQQMIQDNQSILQQSQDWASQQIQNIMSGNIPQQQEGTAEIPVQKADIQRFQDLMSGNITGLKDVNPLDLSQQQVRASALRNLAGQAGTEQGRRNLLEQTFKRQGEYTQGMSDLDQLITGGQESARDMLTQGVSQQGEQLGQTLQDLINQSTNQLSNQQLQLQQATSGLSQLVQQNQKQLQDSMDQQYQQELSNRMQMGQTIEQAIQSAEQARQQKLSQLVGSGAKSFSEMDQGQALKRIAQLLVEAGGVEGSREGRFLGELSGDVDLIRNNLSRVNENKIKSAIQNIIDNYGTQGISINSGDIFNELYRGSSDSGAAQQDQYFKQASIVNAFQNLQEQIQGVDIARAIKESMGMPYEDFLSGKDLEKYDVASEQDISRYNALQRLIGSEAIIAPEMRDTDIFDTEDLQRILSNYGITGQK